MSVEACTCQKFEGSCIGGCKLHGCHACGGVILADTEDWKHPRCNSCFVALGEPDYDPEKFTGNG